MTKYVFLFFMLAYLLAQSISDARTGQIYSFWNNLVTYTTTGLLLLKIVLGNEIVTLFFIVDIFFMLLGCIIVSKTIRGKKIMQPADAKVIWSVFCLASVFIGYDYGLYIAAFMVLFSTLGFMAYYRWIKKCACGDRKPYFPFLTGGYFFSIILFLLIV